MTEFRPFQPGDTPWALFGLAFGLVYGFLGILVLAFILEGAWAILVLGAPFILFQVASILGFDRFLNWRRRNDPPPPLSAWVRHHSVSIGAAVGASVGLVLRLLSGPILGSTS